VPARPYFLAPKDIENAVVFACTAPRAFATRMPVRSRLYLCNAILRDFMGFFGMAFLLTLLAIGGIGWSLLRRFEQCRGMQQGCLIAEACPTHPHRAIRVGYSKSGTRV
jgi:hypothetical protein